MLGQRTLREPVHTVGIGVHSGARVEMTLRPALPNTGIVFRRTDLTPPIDLPAQALQVGDTRMASTLERDGVKVSTVEHLMAAFAGLGIDNAWVDLTGPEVPIMDGSAGTFVYLIQSVGVEEQPAAKRFIEVLKPVEIRDGDKWARLDPYFGFRLSFSIDFSHPAVDRTKSVVEIDFASTSFVREVARARTFGFVQEVEALRQMGLARGGSFENAIVLDEYRVLNEGGLRFDDEFVKHKALDAIGDLYLAGHSLLAAYSAHKSGHALNNRLVRALVADPDAYRVITFAEKSRAPTAYTQVWAAA